MSTSFHSSIESLSILIDHTNQSEGNLYFRTLSSNHVVCSDQLTLVNNFESIISDRNINVDQPTCRLFSTRLLHRQLGSLLWSDADLFKDFTDQSTPTVPTNHARLLRMKGRLLCIPSSPNSDARIQYLQSVDRVFDLSEASPSGDDEIEENSYDSDEEFLVAANVDFSPIDVTLQPVHNCSASNCQHNDSINPTATSKVICIGKDILAAKCKIFSALFGAIRIRKA